ncbi:hypothetical protein L596_011894 [Steinernema carpocapsae]|uniref:C-type lectin domain-containing protein n=1 Tax=Steinernema carpocapsae TaxID=34508 RepID=A0A4V6A4M0_STECR|nr:hypothetical protein L596_011894 [Steinernema carpocapsae]
MITSPLLLGAALLLSALSASPNCDSGWNLFESSCYTLSATNAIWSDAEAICQQSNAHLVSLHSDEELTFATSVAAEGKNNPMSYFWMGAYANMTRAEGLKAYWTDGSKFDFEKNMMWRDRLGWGATCYAGALHSSMWMEYECDAHKLISVCKKPANGQ